MSMNPYSPVGPPPGGFSLTPEQRQARINRLMNGDYRRQALPPPSGNQSGFLFESSGQNTLTVPGVGANVTNESPLVTLLRKRSYLDPMSQAIWDADPRNQAEIARLRREEAGLPPEATTPNDQTTFADIFGPPPEPPPGTDTTAKLVSWLGTLTPAKRAQWSTSPRTAGQIRALGEEGYSIDPNGNLITPAAPPPPATPPRAPGAPTGAATVPGSVWNNPESEAPRGYNPELWAQREIGPNRTYSGGVTGMGIGGPTNADGTAMYTAPAAVKPTQMTMGEALSGYEPANLFQREKFEGQFSGGPDVMTNTQGNTFERNLLASIAEAAASEDPAVSGRAKFILAAASNPAVLRDMPFTAQSQKVGANLIDRAGYQYDMENGGERRRERVVKPEDTGKGERESKNPFMNRMAKGTMSRRSPMRMPTVQYQPPPPGPMFPEVDTTVYPSTYAWAIDKGIDPWSAKNQRQGMRELGLIRPEKRYPKGTMNMNPFMSAFTNPMPNPQQRIVPVGPAPMSPGMGRLPVMTMPSQNFPMDPQRRPVVINQPHANPFLMGGANRVSGNPFR